MKKIILFSLFVSLVLASCGKTAPAPSTPGGTTAPRVGPNTEHLAKLIEGVDAWNAWRTQNPDVKPDLRSANLQGVNLNGFDFSNAILKRANLSGATLLGANLKAANLRMAKLNNADLLGANLTKANLTKAVLNNAEYNSNTKWPEGFDPVAAGAKLVTSP